MKSLTAARAAKGVAVLGFLLPWTTVSCSGQKIMTATGMDLALGSVKIVNPMTGAVQQQTGVPVVFITLCLIMIGVGLAASYLMTNPPKPAEGAPAIETPAEKRAENAAKAIMVFAGLAVVLAFMGMSTINADQIRRSAANKGVSSMDAAMASMITVKTQMGFWVTVLSLFGAAGLAAASLQGRDTVLKAAPALRFPAPPRASAEEDQRFWDGLADKNDPDLLEEYLTRFPDGRFADLARRRLERAGVEPPPAPAKPDVAPVPPVVDEAVPVVEPATAPAPRTCAACNSLLEAGAAFCTECGAPVDPEPAPA